MVDPFKMKVATGWPKQKCATDATTTRKIVPLTKNAVDFTELYDYGTPAAFIQKVDNSLAGQMRDCAECHVGGGGMEYVMAPKGANLATTARLSLRDLNTVADTYGPLGAPTTSAQFTSVNYFIDQYDEDNDGILGEVIYNDYSQTGVLEMDCLMCHMEGYSWNARKEAVRKGNFDSSRAAGAGLGVVASGTTVTYDSAADGSAPIVDDGVGSLTLSSTVLDAIKASPPSANCSTCHFDLHQVDWKKRGTSWTATMAYETEVHASVGCMGCHERTDGTTMDPLGGVADASWTGSAKPGTPGANVLGHDPSKQFAPYSSLWNANDGKGGAKTCESCHTDSVHAAYGDYGAVDPTDAHTALGLLATIAQNGRDGIVDATHLDIIACDACHTRKLGRGPSTAEGGHTHGSLYEWGTGGALVDSTGTDADGRLTDHESLYVERTMEDNLVRGWSGGKMSSRHSLITMFWRDKDDLFNYGNDPNDVAGVSERVDINADGQDGAMDAVNPSHVRDAMAWNNGGTPLNVLTHDGVVTDAEITAQKAALHAYLPTVGIALDTRGDAAIEAKLKLSFMGVLFRANHGTSPASVAWGAGGCTDCHGDGAGFYNGTFVQKPRDLDISWTNWDGVSKDWSAIGGGKPKWRQVVPFTKVNKDNYSGRDLTLPICSTYYGPSPRPALPALGALGDIGTVCDGPDGLPSTADDGVWTVYAKGDIKADWQFSDYHPTLWAKGLTSRSLAVSAAIGTANTIRNADRSEFLYAANENGPAGPGARIMVDGTTAATRAAIVANLNSKATNYNTGMHQTHGRILGSNCTACHTSMTDFAMANGANNGAGTDLDGDGDLDPFVYTLITLDDGCAEWALIPGADPNDAAPDYECIDVIPGVPTGFGTCSTSCHPDTGTVTPGNPTADSDSVTVGNVTASLGALHSLNDNSTIIVNAQRSSCTGAFNSTCNYVFDLTGCPDGSVVGGNGSNVLVIDGFDAITDCTVSVTVTDSVTLESATAGVDLGAGEDVTVAFDNTVDPVGPVSDVASLDNADGTCTVSATGIGTAVRARIYWGNRESQIIADASDLLGAGVTNNCGTASVRVVLYDAAHNSSNY